MNVINYLGWETCLPRQNSLLRPIEGKQVDQADLNLVQCWKLRVRFSKLSKTFQLHPTFLPSWLQPLEHCSDFSSTCTIFSCCNTAGKVHMMWFYLGCLLFLETFTTFYRVRCGSEVTLMLLPTIFFWFYPVSFWKFMKREWDSFCFSWVYSLACIKNSNTELLLWLWKNSISDILNKDSRLSKIFFYIISWPAKWPSTWCIQMH